MTRPLIRAEDGADARAIREVTEAAFAVAQHSAGTEGAIVDALRAADALTVSLVAVIDGEVVGHVAFSPVTIDGAQIGWLGLGPLSVRPDLHRQGIGTALVQEGLERVRALGGKGCVLVGDPGYYRRFGFVPDPAMRVADVPAEYVMRLPLDGALAAGEVAFHEGFKAS